MKRREFCAAALAIWTVSPEPSLAQQQPRPEFQPVTDDPALPRVLIIGDSISIGYTLPLRAALKGVANVHRPPTNCAHTWKGLDQIDQWLGDGKWDVIHFNWGLWDLAYRSEQSSVYGNRDKINGTVTFTPEVYGENLEKIVLKLKQTNAQLIFATTSYVPDGEAGRFVGDDKRYNKVATKIMKKHDVVINKLNAKSRKIHKTYKKAEGDVHYTSEGSALLGEIVAAKIAKYL